MNGAIPGIKHRLLQTARGAGRGSGGGTLVILAVVCTLFCLIWAPTIIRRIKLYLGRGETSIDSAMLEQAMTVRSELAPHGMSLDDRREFIQNVLVSKRVIAEDLDNGASLELMRQKGEDLVISPTDSTEKNEEDVEEGGDAMKTCCTICLTEYKNEEEICWSHNERCNHVFHRECILEWLLRHDECPCCRHNFLSLDDDDDDGPDQNFAAAIDLINIDSDMRWFEGQMGLLSQLHLRRPDSPYPEIRDEETANGRAQQPIFFCVQSEAGEIIAPHQENHTQQSDNEVVPEKSNTEQAEDTTITSELVKRVEPQQDNITQQSNTEVPVVGIENIEKADDTITSEDTSTPEYNSSTGPSTDVESAITEQPFQEGEAEDIAVKCVEHTPAAEEVDDATEYVPGDGDVSADGENTPLEFLSP